VSERLTNVANEMVRQLDGLRAEGYIGDAVDAQPVDTFMGIGVNEFTSTVTYGIFNDDHAEDFRKLPEPLREQLLDTPMYEDEDRDRVVRHLNLTNEDRARMNPPRSSAVLKSQVTLRTKWRLEDV
jgi:hypothetical protein